MKAELICIQVIEIQEIIFILYYLNWLHMPTTIGFTVTVKSYVI